MLAIAPTTPITLRIETEVICITSLGIDFPRELYTRLHSALAGCQATVLFTSTAKNCRGGWILEFSIHDYPFDVNLTV